MRVATSCSLGFALNNNNKREVRRASALSFLCLLRGNSRSLSCRPHSHELFHTLPATTNHDYGKPFLPRAAFCHRGEESNIGARTQNSVSSLTSAYCVTQEKSPNVSWPPAPIYETEEIIPLIRNGNIWCQ